MPPSGLANDTILCGDAYELIRDVPDDSVHLVITSPPYFRQRDYGAGIGGEERVEEYVDALLRLFRECVRVVRPDGSIVFNVGDKYLRGSLSLTPYRFAIAASDVEGVKLVNEVTWVKRNPTPRQFRRRLVSSTEPFFHFVTSDDYYYDMGAFLADAAKPRSPKNGRNVGQSYFGKIDASELTDAQKAKARADLSAAIQEVHDGKITDLRMKIRGVHAEAFGGQEGGRAAQLARNGFTIIRLKGEKLKRDVIETPVETVRNSIHPAIYPVRVVREFVRLLTPPDALVLDPFMGSGTTAVACVAEGRRYVGFELNPDYCREAEARLQG
ncbi:site-specific DNA-methyltransferase [Candidatus Poribacteria bacterium]|jgi:site-specific DNA-methyltransferase (adenine-specific)|nr:site-specific DNA-methyltransferase [Candidatus Poribacteria bacterium]MBT5534880.1 site-specific DNA-methyltransferase [Candidatus Poribacteria bacterium]MBT5713712.1 site-specific DNA-methyltransferase [Candidatus Poribacteria bacterium]MBT7096082.1 site-specific DNA-methyltransferase [Candidatus Poribacteria bacterium]MBT7809333.1 site-specific DNA-methyltransferase [Candidatus Poribacteria bacterium]